MLEQRRLLERPVDRNRIAYRGDIEGLRAVAILLVVADHADVGWLSGGFVGVDVFFVLSGYLITALLVTEMRTSGTIAFAEFYARRFRRLLPALLVMLLCTFAFAALLLPPADQPRQGVAGATAALWVSNLFFAFSHVDYFSPGAESNLFLHTWSLGVEEQFYLVWPLLIFALVKTSKTDATGRLRLAMGGVLAASLLLCVLVTPRSPALGFYLMPTRAWQFALGALAFLHFGTAAGASDGTARATSLRRYAGWLGLAAICASALAFGSNVVYPGAWAALPSVGAALVLISGAALPVTGVARFLSLKPLQSIGHVSYAWYLWHWPVLLLGAVAVDARSGAVRLGLAALSLALAAASYHLLEKRITGNPRWIARPAFTVVAALASMAVVNVVAIRWHNGADRELAESDFARFESVRSDFPVIYRMGCDDWYQSSEVRICAFGPADATHTAVAIGDSVGLQWFPALAAVFEKPDWRLLVITKSSCPMVDETIFYARIGRDYTECSKWRSDAIATVAALAPDIVILGSSLAYELDQRQWQEGTARVLEPLTKAANRVYVLRPTPLLPFDGPSCLAPRGRLLAALAPTDCSAPAHDSHGDDVRRWLDDAVQRFPNAALVDMNDVVCPGERCRAEQRGAIVYRDAQHLTAEFAGSLAGELAVRIGMGGAERSAPY